MKSVADCLSCDGRGFGCALLWRGSTVMAPSTSTHQRERLGQARETLLRRYHRDRAPADRERLVEEFMPLARHLAHRYHRGVEREDLEQVAALGLVKAIDRFDPDRGVAFTSFAVPTIAGEIKRYFRDLGWSVRVPRDLQELSVRVERETEVLTGRLGRLPTPAELAEACETTVERVLEARGLGTAHFADSLDVPAGSDPDEDVRLLRLATEEPAYARVEASVDL